MAGDLHQSASMDKEKSLGLEHVDTVEEHFGDDVKPPNHLHLTKTLTDRVTGRMKLFALWIALGVCSPILQDLYQQGQGAL